MRVLYLWIILLCFTTGNALAAGKAVDYQIKGEQFSGYFVTPTAGSEKFILLIHDWDGLTEYEVKRAEMLAEQGYTVFAADMYGSGIRPTETSEKKKMTSALYEDRPRMRSLLDGALAVARDKGIDTTNGVAMGYCFGGAVVLELARSGADMKGFVPFHGGLTTPEGQDYSKTKGVLLVLHGTADTSVTMEDFANLAEELESAKVGHEMITYAGAPHAFTVFGSPRYREDADRKSWQRFLGFLQETL